MAVLLKTALVRVSSIQIMQVSVQNKGKSFWKSIYVGDVLVCNTHQANPIYPKIRPQHSAATPHHPFSN